MAELCLFRDKPMAMMLHQAAASELPFLDFCKRQRQQMKTALNLLLGQDHYEGRSSRLPAATWAAWAGTG